MNSKITGALQALAALTVVVFAAGCIGTANQTAQVNDTVNVYYTLTLEDGTVRETNVSESPLTFVLGSGQMIKGFDEAVVGMKPGETKIVVLPPEKAYGEYNKSAQVTLPLQAVAESTSEEIVPGLQFNLYDGYRGQVFLCEVITINKEDETVDIAVNHQLAGKTLTFEITLDSIGEKTA